MKASLGSSWRRNKGTAAPPLACPAQIPTGERFALNLRCHKILPLVPKNLQRACCAVHTARGNKLAYHLPNPKNPPKSWFRLVTYTRRHPPKIADITGKKHGNNGGRHG